jgi:hypothetical protein
LEILRKLTADGRTVKISGDIQKFIRFPFKTPLIPIEPPSFHFCIKKATTCSLRLLIMQQKKKQVIGNGSWVMGYRSWVTGDG